MIIECVLLHFFQKWIFKSGRELNNINLSFYTPHCVNICVFVHFEIKLTIMGFTYSVLGAKPLITPTIKVSQTQFHVTRSQTAIGILDAHFVHFTQYNYSRLDKIIFQFFNPTFGKGWSKSAVRGWGLPPSFASFGSFGSFHYKLFDITSLRIYHIHNILKI